jgi:pyruvate dehydrogenase E2 component (dihydrolipoamide acetyltransferase)
MAVTITIPRLGWNMEEGVFAGWLKQDGETVRAGDALFNLEWEKATQEIEAIDEGTLWIPHNGPKTGDRLAVGAVIGYLRQPGELEPGVIPAQSIVRHAAEVPVTLSPSTSKAAQPVPVRRGRRPISPLARRLARELRIDWSNLEGSGRTGRIRRADVLAAAQARGQRLATSTPPPGDAAGASRVVATGPIRRTIAARLLESRSTTAPVTISTTADATNLVCLRRQFKAAAQVGRDVPSYTDFLVKLTAVALCDHPLLNARWHNDQIEIPDQVNIGIAVDTQAGLLVPVIRNVAALGLGQVAALSLDLIRRGQAGQLQPHEMHGGTFTITNLGPFGVESFTPIINPPECAILGVGRIHQQPVAVGDQIVVRERVSLSLTFDHRIVDGGPAARFLQSLTQLIENPSPRLIP